VVAAAPLFAAVGAAEAMIRLVLASQTAAPEHLRCKYEYHVPTVPAEGLNMPVDLVVLCGQERGHLGTHKANALGLLLEWERG
jgi:hypothetical protein